MKKNYLVSVIVPVYNIENYVGKCIESIINQTYKNLQIIVVDDKSTDRSGIICDEYARKDDRIQVIHHEINKGLIGTTKTGLSMAKGDFIGRVDGDDWIEEVMYEQLLKEIVYTDSDFAVTGYVYEGWEEYGNLVVADAKGVFELTDERRYSIIRKYFFRTISDHCQIKRNMNSLWNKLYKAERLRNAYMQIPDCCTEHDDVISLLIVFMESQRFVMTGGANYHYVKRINSMVFDTSLKRFAARYMGSVELKKILEKYNCYNELIEDVNQMDENYMRALIMKKLGKKYQIKKTEFHWRFPGIEDLSGKKVVLYGAGGVGRDYYQQISECDNCEIVAWIDSNYGQYHYDYCTIQSKDVLADLEYTLIVIAVSAEDTACSILSDLHQLGVEGKNIIWKKPQSVCNKMELSLKEDYYR